MASKSLAAKKNHLKHKEFPSGKKHWKKIIKQERSEVNLKLLDFIYLFIFLKLLDFKANVIFNEKHVGTLCGYSKHVGRTISWSK